MYVYRLIFVTPVPFYTETNYGLFKLCRRLEKGYDKNKERERKKEKSWFILTLRVLFFFFNTWQFIFLSIVSLMNVELFLQVMLETAVKVNTCIKQFYISIILFIIQTY